MYILFPNLDTIEDTNNTSMTLEQLAYACQQMQKQFNNEQAQVSGLHNELNATRNELLLTKNSLKAVKSSSGTATIMPRKPESFSGKGSARNRIIPVTRLSLR